MTKTLELGLDIEPLLADRRQRLGISCESGPSLGGGFVFDHGVDLGK